jgi:hypothetical protein
MTAATVIVSDDSDDAGFNISEQVRCKRFLCPAAVRPYKIRAHVLNLSDFSQARDSLVRYLPYRI